MGNLRYGYFTDDGREYVITDPRTPRPWHNYLHNDEYLVNLTQGGTGASFWQPRGEGLRVNVTEDRDGEGGPRFVYLRDDETGEHWTIGGAPDFPTMDAWLCRVGLGYQTMACAHRGLAASWRVFVPQTDDACELWTVAVTNVSDRPRAVSVVPYVEMHLTGGSTLMDFIAVLGGHYDPKRRAVYGINSCVKFPPRFKAVLASDTAVASATVSRDEFLGHYRDYRAPRALAEEVHNSEAGTEWLGASLRHRLALAPGETATIHLVLGVIGDVAQGERLADRYLAPGEVERQFAALSAGRRDSIQVATPDPQFDRWVNIWLPHQLAFVARWGRVIGRGFRDILQDTFGHRLTDPTTARRCLLETFSKQFPSGKCIRAWRLPTAQLDLQDYADSPSWMVMALAYYLRETGDWDVLAERVPFLNAADPYAAPTEEATVWDHVVLAQRYLLQHLGSHGLSKIYYGDWCDTMNGVGAAGRGESVMLSMQVKWGCDLLAELATRRGDAALAETMALASVRLAASINACAWDGAWYLRAFDDEGLCVGGSCPPADDHGEGRIFLNPQSWSVISGVAAPEREASALAAARAHLDVGYGMILNWPPYTALRPRIGQMSAMTPGFYENGSVYVHGNCFWIYALGVAGQGQAAWDALRAILPDTPNKPNTDTEPFIVPNYYIGPNHARRRERNLYLSGWRTGSAAWLYMTAAECILGVQADYDGLRIAPALPDGWQSAEITRPFRGDRYHVVIRKERGEQSTPGALRITLDGLPLPGNLIRPVGDGDTHRVEVVVFSGGEEASDTDR